MPVMQEQPITLNNFEDFLEFSGNHYKPVAVFGVEEKDWHAVKRGFGFRDFKYVIFLRLIKSNRGS